MPKDTIGTLLSRLGKALPDLSLARDVDIPVYLVHRTPDPEDYIFLIDFERFMREAKTGVFARPALKVWAGRNDFQRAAFARRLREAFSQEFERMREDSAQSKGWFSFSFNDILSGTAAVHFLGTVVLYVAVTGGRMAARGAVSALGLDRAFTWMKGLDTAAKLEAEIAEKQAVVDAALAQTAIVLHRDLYRHAWRDTEPGPLTGIDHDAWPLPPYVSEHLDAMETRSWW